MSKELHFDDEEVGPARETSHPRFVELATEDFFYDVGDDFSPFGNDDGADALSSLEDWYREGGKSRKILRFLKDLLEDWDLPVPKKMLRADAEALGKWCAKDEMHMTYLQSECQAIVATAFGQLKIAGKVEAELVDEARAALRCQLLLSDLARIRHPGWEYADLNRERLLRMQTVLEALSEPIPLYTGRLPSLAGDSTVSISEIANKLVALCKAGQYHEAQALYADDAVSVEARTTPGTERVATGLAAIKAKGEWWTANHEVHSMVVAGPWPFDDRFIVGFKFDVTMKITGQRLQMEEMALYTVKNGKIVREEFFYDAG